jgi:hypothetical protein
VHMCAGTAQPALVAVSCPARTLLTVMVTEQTAISKWRRLVVAQAAVHFAWTEGEFFGACCAHDGRVVVGHVRRAETSAVPERCGLPVLRGPSQATSASGQGGALAPPLSIKMLFSCGIPAIVAAGKGDSAHAATLDVHSTHWVRVFSCRHRAQFHKLSSVMRPASKLLPRTCFLQPWHWREGVVGPFLAGGR